MVELASTFGSVATVVTSFTSSLLSPPILKMRSQFPLLVTLDLNIPYRKVVVSYCMDPDRCKDILDTEHRKRHRFQTIKPHKSSGHNHSGTVVSRSIDRTVLVLIAVICGQAGG